MKQKTDFKRLSIRVRPPKHQKWREAAKTEGYTTLTKFIRYAVDEATREGLRVRVSDRKALVNTRTHLKIVGRNLNVVAMQVSTLAKHPLLVTTWQERMNLSADNLIADCEEAARHVEQVLAELEDTLRRLG